MLYYRSYNFPTGKLDSMAMPRRGSGVPEKEKTLACAIQKYHLAILPQPIFPAVQKVSVRLSQPLPCLEGGPGPGPEV